MNGKSVKLLEVVERVYVVCRAVDIRECEGCIFRDHSKVKCTSGLEELIEELLEVSEV